MAHDLALRYSGIEQWRCLVCWARRGWTAALESVCLCTWTHCLGHGRSGRCIHLVLCTQDNRQDPNTARLVGGIND